MDDLGADVEARGVTGGITAAHVAAQEGSVEALEALLDRGALISAVDDDGLTPIHYACQCGNIEIVRTILKRGVFGEEGEEGMIDTPVVDAKSKSRGVTPLLMAANSGYTHLMELLNNGKRRRVALTAADASGSTALHLAVSTYCLVMLLFTNAYQYIITAKRALGMSEDTYATVWKALARIFLSVYMCQSYRGVLVVVSGGGSFHERNLIRGAFHKSNVQYVFWSDYSWWA